MLEVIVSLTLIAVILGVLSEFLYNGVRLWSKSDRVYQRQYQLKYIYQTLAGDLETAFTGDFLQENAFEGEESGLKFWLETSKGLMQKQYRFDNENHRVSCSSNLWGAKPEEKTVFEEILEWKFEYFDPESGNWVSDWNPSSKSVIPPLVRLMVKTKMGNLGTLVFPLRASRMGVEQ